MFCGGFTNLCRTEIWRMPLSDGHAWSALAVCPSPTANLAPAEADGTDGVGATGALIVTASYVDLRDETSGSTSLLGGGQGMRSETGGDGDSPPQAEPDGKRGVAGVISVFQVVGPGCTLGETEEGTGGREFQVRLAGLLQVPYVATSLTPCTDGKILLAAKGALHWLSIADLIDGAAPPSECGVGISKMSDVAMKYTLSVAPWQGAGVGSGCQGDAAEAAEVLGPGVSEGPVLQNLNFRARMHSPGSQHPAVAPGVFTGIRFLSGILVGEAGANGQEGEVTALGADEMGLFGHATCCRSWSTCQCCRKDIR